MRRLALLLSCAILLSACSRGDSDARARVFAPGEAGHGDGVPTFDPDHPEAALALSADAVARALGAFAWTGAVDWTVTRAGDDAARVHAIERHAVRQTETGDFEVKAEIDPGLGPGAETGKQVVWTGGMTYARALPASFRERPTDHGRDARRFRDESFGMVAALARLYGPALRLEAAGEANALGRTARRYRFLLAKADPAPAAAPAPGASADPDTKIRRAFLDGRVPLSVDGELLADARTGAPLEVRLSGVFGVKDQPGVRATVELLAKVQAIGGAVHAVVAPKALPDERKPAGPSTALEAAGLKKRESGPGGEPADDQE
ncbi:hypothetical protein [Anaeromyxobacter oryzae]|uniref:Lipoprotein n=1 Tax=Anaeromyxobacter oryzae TaxID=2918170 RepID=A0ABN6MVI6_9BACT|nr:hypothetical protein [Anaeromyxobacter oryzae]BDG03753.1 hypothetical protein AMOR_27490 [Anaeromyxobacter oryzae]